MHSFRRVLRRIPFGALPASLWLTTALAAQATRWGDFELLTPRAAPGLTYDATRGRLVLFGGSASSGASIARLRDTLEWDGQTWTRRRTADQPQPPDSARGFAYDPTRNRSLLFAVVNNLPQTWIYTGRAWLQLNPTPQPPVHDGYSAGYDPRRGRLVLFGGTAATGPQPDVWEHDGTAWQQVASTGPAARRDAALAFDPARGKLLLFGGRSLEATPRALDDQWEWDGARWLSVSSTTRPAARFGHALASDGTRVVMFGGRDVSAGSERADTWLWDGSDWRAANPLRSPAARASHAMAHHPGAGAILLVAGQAGAASFADTWLFDGRDWREAAAAAAPSPRTEHAAAFDAARAQVLLFGGRDASGLRNDTHVWRDARWRGVATATTPAARAEHALAFDAARSQTVLFGGTASGGLLDDTWQFDGSNWAQLTLTTKPSTRRAHALVFDRARNRVVLFGGFGAGTLADTWEFDGSQWTQRTFASAPPGRSEHAMTYDPSGQRVLLAGGRSATGSYLRDVWAYDGSAWTIVAAMQLPTARGKFGFAYDERRNRLCLHGGWAGSSTSRFADAWEWNGTAWSSVLGFPIGPAGRSGASMTFDPTGRRVLVFGGETAQGLSAETWSLTTAPSSALEELAGTGCAGASGIQPATIDGFGPSAIGNTSFAFDLFTPPPVTTPLPAFFMLSVAQGTSAASGCVFAVDPGTLFATLYRLQMGPFVSQPLPIPANATLLGANFVVQAAHMDPPSSLNGLVLSRGYRVRIGER